MFSYRLHLEDGSDAGEATYSVMIKPGEEIIAGKNERFRVVDGRPVRRGGRVPFVGLLQVEAAYDTRGHSPSRDKGRQAPEGEGHLRPRGGESAVGLRPPTSVSSQALGSTSRVISLAPLYERLTPCRVRLLRGRARRWRQGGAKALALLTKRSRRRGRDRFVFSV